MGERLPFDVARRSEDVQKLRMPQALIANADAWAKANDIGRSEAIRRLVELGLKAKGK
jgi:hypothetical protein